jgi:hypothetical protein
MLFRRHVKNGERKYGRCVDRKGAPGIKTLRTYLPGGDPVDDTIEFVLTDDGTAPSGFRDPPAE